MATGPFKRSRWKPGNVYAVPLSDGTFGLAQAILESPFTPGVLEVAVFSEHCRTLAECHANVSRASVIALLSTWRAEMNGGWWALVGRADPCAIAAEFSEIQAGTSIDQQIHGGAVVENLLSAFHGLLPWNTNYHEDYYDRLLASGIPRPQTAHVLNPVELAIYREQSQNARAAT